MIIYPKRTFPSLDEVSGKRGLQMIFTNEVDYIFRIITPVGRKATAA